MAMETDKKKKAAKKVHATFRSSMMRPQMKDKPLKAKEKEVVEKKGEYGFHMVWEVLVHLQIRRPLE